MGSPWHHDKGVGQVALSVQKNAAGADFAEPGLLLRATAAPHTGATPLREAVGASHRTSGDAAFNVAVFVLSCPSASGRVDVSTPLSWQICAMSHRGAASSMTPSRTPTSRA